MLDVFTEEIEIIIKAGIANLYWYKGDLKKVWLRSKVKASLVEDLFLHRNEKGFRCTKRQLMDLLYEELRNSDYNRRLEISRNFVRVLIEHKNFVPQDEKHRIEIAERCSLKIKEIILEQEKNREYKERIKRKTKPTEEESYQFKLKELQEKFEEIMQIKKKQKRGYELENCFSQLMIISGIPMEKSFKIVGEQIDNAIKYDGHYYLLELKWVSKKCNQTDISNLYLKVEGKLGARGIFLAMNGYSKNITKSLPKGKSINVLLLDGNHLTNVIYGNYNFKELLEHAISQASIKGEIYCSHDITR